MMLDYGECSLTTQFMIVSWVYDDWDMKCWLGKNELSCDKLVGEETTSTWCQVR